MKAPPFLSSVARKSQTLRILSVLTIFFILASISRYHGSIEFSIDEDGQVQSVPKVVTEHDIHYTHHIATYDQNDIKYWTKGDTDALRTIEGQELVRQLTDSPFQKPSPENQNNPYLLKSDYFAVLTKRLRVYRALWHSLKSYYDQLAAEGKQELFYFAPPTDIAPAVEFLQRLEQSTFPWIWKHHKTSYDLQQEHRDGGRGIIMCVGNYHSKFARSSVKALREVLKSKLPIEIYYRGNNDLSPENRAWFETFKDVRTIDITTVIDDEMLRLGGWAIKPFAMLVSRFNEVVLMDSDASFLEDPEVMFEDDGYKEVGTVYFYDRTLFPGISANKIEWMKSFLPTMSNHPAKTRWFQLKSDHEMESGVVVLDKRRHFLGLMAICKINDYYEREQVTYQKTWGDKESFWIGLEMIQERYSFVRYGGGVIGNVGDAIPYKELLPEDEINRYLNGETLTATNPINPGNGQQVHRDSANMDRVCGNLAHFDYKGDPLWWNSGVVRDKYTFNSPYLKYTAYMRDEDGEWDFGNQCLVQRNPSAIREVEWEQRKTAFGVLKADREVAVELNQQGYKDILEIPKLIQSEGAKGGNGNRDAI
ncbi:mannosyltransferase putative-domain-containing protein [Dissophora ornata]|nr:hypothetical protein BGZ58_010457 [Dissophora ornata]KAI8602379.1 mannosyltransferase putative-domain-containing protein [Dissophora ornata]